jgi:hypothetical protein
MLLRRIQERNSKNFFCFLASINTTLFTIYLPQSLSSLTFLINAARITNDTFAIGTFLVPYLRFKRLSNSNNKLASTRAETVLSKRLIALFGGGGVLNLLLSKQLVFIEY